MYKKIRLYSGLRFINAALRFLCTPFSYLLKILGVRVLAINFYAIGHLAMEPDVYLRELRLLGKRRWTFLLPPPKRLIANKFLLRCWAEYFFVVSNSLLQFFLNPFLRSPVLTYDPVHFFTTKLSPFYVKEREATEIYKNYGEKYSSHRFIPLLKLKEIDLENGKKTLTKLGLPLDAWYVCFHCREEGYKTKESEKWACCRNSTIANVELALTEVIRRGGWCIRMGSSKTVPLPDTLKRYKQIIDYPHTPEVSDFMDIFLAATCRFFLGNNSGITAVANVFGTPCACTNIVPFGMRTLFSKDLNIFKLQRSKITGQLVPFVQCVRSYLSNSISMQDYEEQEIELVENSPEEILAVTKEMLDFLEKTLVRFPEEEMLQQKFLKLLTSFNLHHRAPSRIGSDFLKKYHHLI